MTETNVQLVAHIRDGFTVLQKAAYIEDGWYIKVTGTTIELWELPTGGGIAHLISTHESITDAYNAGEALC